MAVNMAQNDNWKTCSKCGEPILIDPKTGQVQPCANCATVNSKPIAAAGFLLIALGIMAIVTLVFLCIRILL